jgi:hypothetical protein
MKNQSLKRIISLAQKEIQIIKNNLTSILFLFVFYFIIFFFISEPLKKSFALIDKDLFLLILNLILLQTILIISLMLLPIFIYNDSIKDKQEVYFAYQYSILEIILGKAFILSVLCLIPAYTMIFVFFPTLIKFSFLSFVNFGFVFPIFTVGLLLFLIMLTWFTKIGKLTPIICVIFLILFFSNIFKVTKTNFKITSISTIAITFILSILLISISFLMAKLTKKEKWVLKNN